MSKGTDLAAQAPQLSERDVVMRERAAFVRGAAWSFCRDEWSHGSSPAECRENARREAAKERYPLPSVTRPRVVTDTLEWRVRWSVSDDRIVGESVDCGHWFSISDGHSAFAPYSSRVKLWADLLANPVETVEDES